MRQNSPGPRRSRGRHGGGGNGGNSGGQPSGGAMRGGENRVRSATSLRHQTFDSNGPDVRVRGNAWQVYEKYQSLARDAVSAGDRVMAENYQQHAEHYYRITEAIEEATAAEQRQRGGGQPQSFGGQQQPDVPTNYYTPDGQLAAAQQPQPQQQPGFAQSPASPQPVASGMDGAMPQPVQQDAIVEVKRKAPVPTALFSSDEAEDTDSCPQTLVAQR